MFVNEYTHAHTPGGRNKGGRNRTEQSREDQAVSLHPASSSRELLRNEQRNCIVTPTRDAILCQRQETTGLSYHMCTDGVRQWSGAFLHPGVCVLLLPWETTSSELLTYRPNKTSSPEYENSTSIYSSLCRWRVGEVSQSTQHFCKRDFNITYRSSGVIQVSWSSVTTKWLDDLFINMIWKPKSSP